MKKLTFLTAILLALPMIGFGQNVSIPDPNFKAYLVGNSAINTNGDNQIQVSEASAFNGTINVNNLNINSLIGIEAFVSLNALYCVNNVITNLDLSGCTSLTFLGLSSNSALTSLDVSGCTALTSLDCIYNQSLTNLDLSACTALTYLMCQYTQLTSLDVRNGNNTNLTEFYSSNNPNLTCINVDDATWSTANWTVANGNIDSQHYFSNNCSGTSSIQELNTNKKLLKVTDLLGRETKATNQVLIHIYDDGTLEKKIVFE